MPQMTYHPGAQRVKMLVTGNSGEGKTGALASLINAGEKVAIIDFDNGCDVLLEYVEAKHLSHVWYETCYDDMKTLETGESIPVGSPNAWPKAMKLLNHWKLIDKDRGPLGKVPGYDLGKVKDWGPDMTLVIDSMTGMNRAIMWFERGLNNLIMRQGTTWNLPWGGAIEDQEQFLTMLFSDTVKCNVIVTAHKKMLEVRRTVEVSDKKGDVKLVEIIDAEQSHMQIASLGNKFPEIVPRFFNTWVECYHEGHGITTRRLVTTLPTHEFALKTPVKITPSTLPLEEAYMKIFSQIRGKVKKQQEGK